MLAPASHHNGLGEQEGEDVLLMNNTEAEISQKHASSNSNANEERCCRICLDGDDEDDGNLVTPAATNSLIAPCRCKGSQKWVHRKCLDDWRATNPNNIAFSKCTECLFDYRLKYTGPVAGRNEYYYYVTRDIGGGCLGIQLLMLSLGWLTWFINAVPSSAAASQSTTFTLAGFVTASNASQLLAGYYVTGLLELLVCLGVYGLFTLCFNKCSVSESISELEEDATRWTGTRMPSRSSSGVTNRIHNQDDFTQSEMMDRSVDSRHHHSRASSSSPSAEPYTPYYCYDCYYDPCYGCGRLNCNCNGCYCDSPSHHNGDSCCCYCHDHVHTGSSGGRTDCDCDCDCGGNGNNPLLIILLVAGIILAAVGLVVGIFLVCFLFQRILQKHLFRLHKKRLAQNYVVQDLSELESIDDYDFESQLPSVELPPRHEHKTVSASTEANSACKGRCSKICDVPNDLYLKKLGLMED